LARDLSPDWLEVLSAFAPRPDLVLYYPGDPTGLANRLDLDGLDLYEAGMDLGLTRDVPLGYQLYHERILTSYEEWARAHEVELVRPQSTIELLRQIQRDLGLEIGDVDARLRGVSGLLRDSLDVPHALQVVELARQLFEQLRPLHKLGPGAAHLLVVGALLHTLGLEAGAERDGRVRTAELIDKSRLLGFSEAESKVLAALAAAHTMQHHRELDVWLATVPIRYRETIRKLAPIARLAAGMDANHKQAVRRVEAILHDECQLLVRMRTRTRARDEVKATRGGAHLMEVVYGLEVDVVAERQGPPPACADLRPLMTVKRAARGLATVDETTLGRSSSFGCSESSDRAAGDGPNGRRPRRADVSTLRAS
jgi:hypothetical protein